MNKMLFSFIDKLYVFLAPIIDTPGGQFEEKALTPKLRIFLAFVPSLLQYTISLLYAQSSSSSQLVPCSRTGQDDTALN